MEGVVSWVKSIAYYVILVSLFQGFLPDNRYKKYVQLFTGMVLTLLVLSPVLGFQRQEQTLSDAFTDYVTEMLEQGFTEEAGQLRMQTYYEAEIRQLMEHCGYEVCGIRLSLDKKGIPESVLLSVRQKAEAQEKGSMVQEVTPVQIGRDKGETEAQTLGILEELIQQQYDLKEGKVRIQVLP